MRAFALGAVALKCLYLVQSTFILVPTYVLRQMMKSLTPMLRKPKQSTLGVPLSGCRLNAAKRWARVAVLCACLIIPTCWAIRSFVPMRWLQSARPHSEWPSNYVYGVRRVPLSNGVAAKIVAGAKAQIGTRYDAAYVSIAYPDGDVEASRGACTDVVIRAFRAAGFDLQRRIHEDMKANWSLYPKKWGLAAPNPSIDHRRVPNQIAYLQHRAKVLSTSVDQSTLKQWQPGDVVYWKTSATQLHTGILSDGVDADGIPLVIHNGSICVEDNCLTRWPIIGHFRLPANAASRAEKARHKVLLSGDTVNKKPRIQNRMRGF